MPHSTSRSRTPIVLRLPSGAQYRLELSSDELATWLAPGRTATLETGPPLEVEIRHRGERYAIPVGPRELQRLLSRSTLEADHAVEHPERPRPVANPLRGRGLRDPDAHRVGPSAEHAPDPGHRGIKHRRTP
jgi:hypothetical protein